MPTLLRELYLTLLFVVGAGAVIAPYFGISLPVFSYQTAKGGTVDMPLSVAAYAIFLLIGVAALAKRFVKPDVSREVVLCLLFLTGSSLAIAPVFGFSHPASYPIAKSGTIGIPFAVTIYAVFLFVVSIAFVKRFRARLPKLEVVDAQ